MRARAGDPPRNMTQKILAGRSDDPMLGRSEVVAKVDHIALSKEPNRALWEAEVQGFKKAAVEAAVAYDPGCITTPARAWAPVQRSAIQKGVAVVRSGMGFPAAVHLERYGSPARLLITDDPRFAALGGAGMLPLVVSPSQLGSALCHGTIVLCPPRSVQILLSGKLRPFVCVRDVALELLSRGLADVVRRVDMEEGAPVVLEFAGPSARLLSVADRAVLCMLAPRVGAAGAVFVSDEKTEVYLRDQRRSKAHRALVPDPGAPCADVLNVDLTTVDPLVLDPKGQVRSARELAGIAVTQVVLGGDTGTSLRELLTVAALLKSKRVPPGLDFLLALPSRQGLEVLARSGALVDLIATGARIIEPDAGALEGALYPPHPTGISVRTCDPEPTETGFVVASPETAAYAVASGQLDDPRSFKRPARVSVPRSLPTDDVLIIRKPPRGKSKLEPTQAGFVAPEALPRPWAEACTLRVVRGAQRPESAGVVVVDSLMDLRYVVAHATSWALELRAIVAPFIPHGMIPRLAGLGILALLASEEEMAQISQATTVKLSAVDTWSDSVDVAIGESSLSLRWIAAPRERDWTKAATAKTLPNKGRLGR